MITEEDHMTDILGRDVEGRSIGRFSRFQANQLWTRPIGAFGICYRELCRMRFDRGHSEVIWNSSHLMKMMPF